MKQIHFRIEEELWYKFKRLFPFRGEPSAFLKRCIMQVVEHAEQQQKQNQRDIQYYKENPDELWNE